MKISISFLIMFLITGILSRAQDNSYKPNYSTVLDSSKGKEMLHQCSRRTPKKVTAFWNLAESDIQNLELNLKKILSIEPNGWLTFERLKAYTLQYIGIKINDKKYIYINAFSSSVNSEVWAANIWKTEPIVVCDGWRGFWGVLFDPGKLEFSQLEFNGIA